MNKRIKRADIGGANLFRYDEKCSPEAKVVINDLLAYIFELELALASKGQLQRTVTGFDDVIGEPEPEQRCLGGGCRFCEGED